MEQIPVLKYEILLNFHKFKESRKVAATAPVVPVTPAATAAAEAPIKQDMDNEASHDV
jgi:hypothetical protein